MLNHLEIESYFSSIVSYNDVDRPKPNPDMVNVLLDKYKIKNKMHSL